jgi:hypothetical protein
MNLGTKDDLRVQLRRGATAVAAARVALGVLALARPGVPSRPWVGVGAGAEEGTAGLAVRVLGRALGGRDLGLGLGALAAITQEDGESSSMWVAAGALCDGLDVAATLASWRELPRVTRWLVLSSAAGASLAGAAGAVALRATRAAG